MAAPAPRLRTSSPSPSTPSAPSNQAATTPPPENQGGASGAYQYVDSTWNGYRRLRPPTSRHRRSAEDARATSDVQAVFAKYGDVAFVPIIWYWPQRPPTRASSTSCPGPRREHAHRPRSTNRWLALYQTKLAGAPASGCTGSTAGEDGYALPLDRTLIAANPAMLDQPHHDYPADRPHRPGRSPVYAVRGGHHRPHRRLAAQLLPSRRLQTRLGVGVSINGDDGARYISLPRLPPQQRQHRPDHQRRRPRRVGPQHRPDPAHRTCTSKSESTYEQRCHNNCSFISIFYHDLLVATLPRDGIRPKEARPRFTCQLIRPAGSSDHGDAFGYA